MKFTLDINNISLLDEDANRWHVYRAMKCDSISFFINDMCNFQHTVMRNIHDHITPFYVGVRQTPLEHL